MAGDGHQVRTGEKGVKIIAPIFVKNVEENEVGQLTSLQKLVGFRVVSVFDSSQLTEPAKAFWDFRKNVPDDAEDKYQLVKRAVMSDALRIVEEPMPRGKRGEATEDVIYLQEGMDSVDWSNVLIHEWGMRSFIPVQLEVWWKRASQNPFKSVRLNPFHTLYLISWE